MYSLLFIYCIILLFLANIFFCVFGGFFLCKGKDVMHCASQSRYPIHIGLHEGVIGPLEPHGLTTNSSTLADLLLAQGYSTHAVGEARIQETRTLTVRMTKIPPISSSIFNRPGVAGAVQQTPL